MRCKNCNSENPSEAKFCAGCGHEINTGNSEKKQVKESAPLGFTWWTVWGWLGFILGSLLVLAEVGKVSLTWGIIGFIVNAILMSYVLAFNKHAFLIATVLSLNPILWIINGIYLRNRWEHPKVNKNKVI